MALVGLLNQAGSLYTKSTRNKYGKTGFGSAVAIKMRFQKTSTTILNNEREPEPIDGIVFVGPDVTIDVGDKLTYNSVTYRVMTVEPIVVGNGSVHHKELKVQEWNL